MPATSSRISASSSTTRISAAMSNHLSSYVLFVIFRIGASLAGRFRAHASLAGRRLREDHAYRRAAASVEICRRVMQCQMSAMILDDRADNRETKAGALLARRHIGFEQLLAVVAWQARAIVDDIDNQMPFRLIRADNDMHAFAFLGVIFLWKSV